MTKKIVNDKILSNNKKRNKTMIQLPEFIKNNQDEYVSICQLFKRGTVDVLELAEDGTFVQDTLGICYMLATKDVETAVLWLNKHKGRGYDIFEVFDEKLADLIRNKYGLENELACGQAIYKKSTPPFFERSLSITPADENHFQFIREHYSNLDDEELVEVIKRRELFIGRDKNENIVGFVGQHMEGSMGLLEILPEYQRIGYGYEMECFMISHMIESNLIPYCQFVIGNTASIELQKKIGLEICGNRTYWLY